MMRAVSIFLLCTYPILVFADTLYFKDDTRLEGEIIDYKENYIIFRVDNTNEVRYPEEYAIKVIDSQTIQFNMDYIYMATDSDGEIVAMRTGQDDSIIGSNDVQYQEQAKADAMEDFDSRLKWSGISTAAFIGGLYFLWTEGFLIGSTVAFAAPIYIIHLTPVDNSRLNNLRTKNEKHRNAYRTAYEKETRKQRLKYSLLGTGSSTVAVVAYAAVAVVTIMAMFAN